MLSRAFFYDIASESWKECTDPSLLHMEIENIPIHIIIHRCETVSSASRVWCKEHQAYEQVEKADNLSLTTATGCHMHGLIGKGIEVKENYSISIKIKNLPLLWKVTYYENKDVVLITKESPTIFWGLTMDKCAGEKARIPHIREFNTEGLTIRFFDEKLLPEKNCKEMPDCVADAAIDFLLNAAERNFGERPVLPASIHSEPFADGRVRLEAFLHYPWDMNLWLLKVYFNPKYQDKDIFTRTSKDPFLGLCRKLEMNPSDTLRKYHEAYPFAIIMATILRYLGISNLELARPFLSMHTFAGDSLSNNLESTFSIHDYHELLQQRFSPINFSDDEAVRAILEARRGCGGNEKLTALFFYCQWYLSKTGEERLAHHLLYLQEHWDSHYLYFMDCFYNNYPDIPLEIRQIIIDRGLTIETENAIIDAINKRKLNWPDFFYTDEQEGYACEIDGYEFRLIYSSDEFHSICKKMLYSNPSMSPAIKNDGVLRIAVFRQGHPEACLLVHSIIKIIYNERGLSIYGHRFQPVSVRIAVLHWLKWTGLYKSYGPYFESDYEFLDHEVQAKPLPKSDDLPLYDLLNLPENKIHPGYYMRLKEAFSEAKLLYREVPSSKEVPSEMDFLMEMFPFGERIYKAAFEGNHEAQKALALCYGETEHSAVFKHDKSQYEQWNYRYERNEA